MQMNCGAKNSRAEWLYFVHADTYPPESFMANIAAAVAAGYDFGYFSYTLDSPNRLLKFNSRATRYDTVFSGGGDQTLFIRRSVFDALGGFDERLHIMEDFDLVWRAKRAGYRHLLVANDATTSARKYVLNSWLRVNLVNLSVFVLFHLGVPTALMARYYRRWLSSG
jgi:GT2 family glycosyltransferase